MLKIFLSVMQKTNKQKISKKTPADRPTYNALQAVLLISNPSVFLIMVHFIQDNSPIQCSPIKGTL